LLCIAHAHSEQVFDAAPGLTVGEMFRVESNTKSTEYLFEGLET
jgi:hypothetical protein